MQIDTILPALKATSRNQALQVLATYAADDTGLDYKGLLDRLLTAEGRASSGIGGGVAIPQLVLKGLRQPYSLFAAVPQLIDFNALDGAPVDLIFLLLSPDADGPLHLQRLARITRMLRDRDLCQSLRGAENTDTLRVLLSDSAQGRLAA